LASHPQGGTQIQGVQAQNTEENIWSQEKSNGKKLQNEELHNFYSLPNIIRVIKTSMGVAGHIAHIRR
jgi:hypothetical protein